MQIILLNKPVNVLCQFTEPGKRLTLADYLSVPGIYVAGRLDYESEGLLVLTDTGRIQKRITDPGSGMLKTYWVQVEASENSIKQLAGAFKLEEGLPCSISILPIKQPAVWPRNPPLAERLQTSWLEITVTDDRNMQIRQKIAAVGLTTVRLIRHAVGPWKLGKLKPGEWKVSSIPTEWLEYSADKI